MMTQTRPTIAHPTTRSGVAVEPSIEMATSLALKDEVYALRYQAYRRVDLIPDYPSRRFSDPYDLEPSSMSYLLRDHGGHPLGAIRASLYLPEVGNSLPSFESYRDEITARIGLDKRIVESSRFVTAEASFDVLLDTQFQLFRMIWANLYFHGADWMITSMQRKHVALYRRLFDCEVLSEPKPYPGVSVKGILCGLSRDAMKAAVERQPRLALDLAEASWYAL